MKRSIVTLCLLVLCASCNQGSPTSNADPNGSGPIELLLIETYMGLTIGDSASGVYTRLQSLYAHDSIGPISIVGNIFTDPSYLSYLTPLYSELHCDSGSGTSDGVQFGFKLGTLASIYLNSGTKLSSWPSTLSGNLTINIGDNRSLIASKVDSLAKTPGVKNHLEKFSLFLKDMTTPADSFMLSRPEWYFSHSITVDSLIVTTLFFDSHKLQKVRNEHVKLLPLPW